MVLEKENIFINCTPQAKEDIIRQIGDRFCSLGYTDSEYTQAMLDKEKVFNTNIGNSIAIPHGTEEAKRAIKKTGMILMTFPEGVDWGNDQKVKVVIGIAAVGDEHLDVLSKIAMTLSEESEVEALLGKSVDEIHDMFEEA